MTNPTPSPSLPRPKTTGAASVFAQHNPLADGPTWRTDLILFTVIVLLIMLFTTVEALSLIGEASRRGQTLDARLPWLLKGASGLALLPPALLLIAVRRRLRGPQEAPLLWLGLTPILMIAVCAVHIIGTEVLRKLAFLLWLDSPYTLFDAVWRDLLTEGRKDAVSTLLLLLIIEAGHRIGARAQFSPGPVVAIQSGATTVRVAGEDMLFVKAAANYAEIHTRHGEHLVRATLADLTTLFTAHGIQLLRIHRSYLVAKNAVLRLEPTKAGDCRLLLWDGTVLNASRRYKEALDILRESVSGRPA